MSTQLLNTKSACLYLFVCRTTLYKLVRTGQLKGHFFAKAWKFRQTDLEAYLDRMAVGR